MSCSRIGTQAVDHPVPAGHHHTTHSASDSLMTAIDSSASGYMSPTPLWVPLLVAGLGIVGTVAGTVSGVVLPRRKADQRDSLSWDRERKRTRVVDLCAATPLGSFICRPPVIDLASLSSATTMWRDRVRRSRANRTMSEYANFA